MEILKILDLIINKEKCQINITEVNIGKELRLKNIEETKNYFFEEIKQY